MRWFRGFAIAGAGLAFAIAILGSWVRINGAGLTCPDWPLCHGALVPTLHGGVTLEWSHRLAALAESLIVVGTIVTGARVASAVTGVRWVLVALGSIFFAQVVLGGATVLLGNSPLSVMAHWAAGMALLGTFAVLAVLALLAPDRAVATQSNPNLATLALATAAAFAFATMCVGAYVSSSGAGRACTSFPACDATLLGTSAAQGVHMLHRLLAAAFALVAVGATALALRASAATRNAALAGCALVLAQIALGAANVAWRLPAALREAHAANAAATFVAFALAMTLAAVETQPVTHRQLGRTRSAHRIAPTA